jgi:carboxyl-terminal processing protease
MTVSIPSTQRRVLCLIAVAGLLLAPLRLAAEPTPGKHDRLVVQMVCQILHRGHLRRPEIGTDLSKRLFQRFLKDVDPGKLYFLKSDIEEFKKQETKLDAMLLKGDLSFAYKVYQRLAVRIGERQKLVEELVKAPQDFTVKEYLETDGSKLDYATSEDELRERWRKRIKFDLLLQRLEKKPPTDDEARKKVRERYQRLARGWKQLDNYDLAELYLSDLAACVDPHSSYMSPNTLEDFAIAMRLRLEGIGALLRTEDGQTIIAEVVPGGAAALDGRLKPNDKIIAVAQGDRKFVDVIDMKPREVVKLIRGPKGTKVDLKVLPAGKLEPVIYTLTRRQIEIKEQAARYEIVDQGKKADGKPYRIGVIDLPSFYGGHKDENGKEVGGATEDVRRILREMKTKGVDGVILDVRYNGGGLLEEALGLTGLFIDEGPIVQVKGANGRVERRDDPEQGVVYDGPLMVLMSRFSASASEILAGTLQDYGRALIVGDPATHGKGTVQTVIDLSRLLQTDDPPPLGALRLTIQQFYRVNGDSTQNRGVASDVVVPAVTEYLATPEKDMEQALAFDRVKPVDHEILRLVSAELKTILQKRSTERVKASKDFAKLARTIEQLKNARARKEVSLNEKELKEKFNREEAEKAERGDSGEPKPEARTGPYKLVRNFYTNEVLNIMEDFIQGKKLIADR